MYTYKLTIAYNGTQYYGWQIQPQKDRGTIQGVIEESIVKLFGKRIPLIASSRTDSGVHALGQVAHIRLEDYISPRQLFSHFRITLPHDIDVRLIERVSEDFHSRHSLYKCYEYSLWRGRISPTPFISPFVWHTPLLDVSLLQKAIPYLIGTRNYALFRNYASSDTSSVIRTIFALCLRYHKEHPEIIRLRFWGNGFVRSMIRNLVGLLIYVGRKKIALNDIPMLLQKTQRKELPSQTAPPQGLILHHVQYPPYVCYECYPDINDYC